MNERRRLIKYDTSKPEQQELLRKVLVDTWGGRCHWCGAVFPSATYADMDHIIPKTRFKELKAHLGSQYEAIYTPEFLATLEALPEDPDEIHNIAPACRVARNCNGKKSNTMDADYMGVIVEGLKKAKANEQTIPNKVNKLLDERGLTGHLVGCLALPDTDEVRHATRELGPQVLMSLWQVDKEIFGIFLPPGEVLLEMDAGELPDYFDTAFPSGTGLDGDVKLSNSERLTLMGARVVSGVDAFEETAKAIAAAVSDIDDEMINELGDVPHPGLIGPRWLSVIDHQIIQSEKPEFEVRFRMKATFGGQAVLDSDTDNDGAPRYEHRQVEQEHLITCRVGLMDGDVTADGAMVSNEWD
jgi:5-methylcytosine-specific restriction endonuclease McrA